MPSAYPHNGSDLPDPTTSVHREIKANPEDGLCGQLSPRGGFAAKTAVSPLSP
jgi:hypothetical protein